MYKKVALVLPKASLGAVATASGHGYCGKVVEGKIINIRLENQIVS